MFFPKDRAVEFPNRYKMVKVPGTDDIFDMIPAPGEISEEGTFWNGRAAQLLQADRRFYPAGEDLKSGDVVDVQVDGTVKAEYLYDAAAFPSGKKIENVDFYITGAITEKDDPSILTAVGYGLNASNQYVLRIGQIIGGKLYNSTVIDTNTSYNSSTAFNGVKIARISNGLYAVAAEKSTASSNRQLTIYIVNNSGGTFTVQKRTYFASGDYHFMDLLTVDELEYPYVFFTHNTSGGRLDAYNYEDGTYVSSPYPYSITQYAGFVSDRSKGFFGYNFVSIESSPSYKTMRTIAFNPIEKKFSLATWSQEHTASPVLVYLGGERRDVYLSVPKGLICLHTNPDNGIPSYSTVSDKVLSYYKTVNFGRTVFAFSTDQAKKCMVFNAPETNSNSVKFTNESYNEFTSTGVIGVFIDAQPAIIRTNGIENAYLYQLRYDPQTMQLGGEHKLKSSEAIVLADVTAGSEAEVIFSGTAKMDGITQGTIIESPGVYGVSPTDGIINVYEKDRPRGLIASGSYVGTGTYGADNPVELDFGFSPSLLFIYGERSSDVYFPFFSRAFGAVNLYAYGNDVRTKGLTVEFTERGVKFYSTSNEIEQLNVLGLQYKYIAFK